MQQCSSVDGFQEIDIESASEPGKWYTVVISNFDGACDCIGYTFNQKCSHLRKAKKLMCKWVEGQDPQQSPMQRRRYVCPRCGGPTKENDGKA